jgi:hypothetical protein
MRARSSLSEDQREAAVAWFEKGLADTATATVAGRVPLAGQGCCIGGGGSMVKERWWLSRRNSRIRSTSSSRWSNGSSRVRLPRIWQRRLACLRRPAAEERGCVPIVARRGRLAPEAQRQAPEARLPTAGRAVRAGAAAAGERAVAGRSGLPGKIAGLEGSKTTVKVQALIALKADFPLPVLLQVSGLARSTFFYHQARFQAPDPQEELKAAITDIFTANHGRYGHRRIHRELLNKAGQSRRRPC